MKMDSTYTQHVVVTIDPREASDYILIGWELISAVNMDGVLTFVLAKPRRGGRA